MFLYIFGVKYLSQSQKIELDIKKQIINSLNHYSYEKKFAYRFNIVYFNG